MAKSEQAKQLNAQIRILANQEFIAYKEYMANEFINEFGGSYQTVEKSGDSWRKTFEYTPKREDFIKFKSKIFLRMLPANNKIYAHPHFLSVLTYDICNYLAHYIIRKDKNLNVVDTAKELYSELYTNNSLIKYKQKVFSSETSIARNEKRKAEQQAAQQKSEPRKRKRIYETEEKPAERAKNKKPFLTSSQEKKARKRMEYIHNVIMNQHNLTVCISVKTIEK